MNQFLFFCLCQVLEEFVSVFRRASLSLFESNLPDFALELMKLDLICYNLTRGPR